MASFPVASSRSARVASLVALLVPGLLAAQATAPAAVTASAAGTAGTREVGRIPAAAGSLLLVTAPVTPGATPWVEIAVGPTPVPVDPKAKKSPAPAAAAPFAIARLEGADAAAFTLETRTLLNRRDAIERGATRLDTVQLAGTSPARVLVVRQRRRTAAAEPMDATSDTLHVMVRGVTGGTEGAFVARPDEVRALARLVTLAATAPVATGPVVAKAFYAEQEVTRPAKELPGSCQAAYPAELRDAGAIGDVQAQFVVKADGVVDAGSLKILASSGGPFTTSVRAALPCLRFQPAELGGQKVAQLVNKPFTFQTR